MRQGGVIGPEGVDVLQDLQQDARLVGSFFERCSLSKTDPQSGKKIVKDALPVGKGVKLGREIAQSLNPIIPKPETPNLNPKP